MKVLPPLAIALLVLLAVPLASAQLPSGQACGPILIPAAPAQPAPIAPGGTADVVVVVENTGGLTATVTVAATSTRAGWTVSEPPEPAAIPGGQSGTFTFTVTAGADASENGLVSFAATGTCDPPTPLPRCTLAQCPNAGNANTQVEVPLQRDAGFTFPVLGDFPLEYLIAAIVLVGLASAIPFLMRRKHRGGVVAGCPEPLKMVRAGRGASFPIEIRNAGKDAISAQFEVGPVPDGWSAFMPLPEVQLAPREARSLWLMVRSPQTAAIGEAVDIELRLSDPKRAGPASVVKVRAEVQGGADG